MRKLVYTTVIFTGFLIFYFQVKENTPSSIEIPEIKNEISKNIDDATAQIIKKINKSKSDIKNAYHPNMPIKIKSSGLSFKLSGQLAYQKENLFRLVVSHRLTGKEMDLGSNSNIFWFWSKRINPPALYFSKHENLYRTNLKSALNPVMMMESLNLNEINLDKIKSFYNNKNHVAIVENRQSPTNETLDLVTIIDNQTLQVVEKNLQRQDGSKIVTTFYKDNKIFFDYHEENVFMEWDLSDIKTNVSLSTSYWDMPTMTHTIDIGND